MKITKRIKNICKYVWVNVRRWIKNCWTISCDTMRGACAIGSYALYRLLKYKGYSPNLVLGLNSNTFEGHCYVELGGYIIDITCKQFNFELPDILIVKKDKYINTIPKIKEYNRVLTNRSAIKDFQEWVEEQNPLKYKNNINKLVRESKSINFA